MCIDAAFGEKMVNAFEIVYAAVLAQVFTEPLDIPTNVSSLLLALPICLSIAVVYKAIKLEEFTAKLYIREVLLLFVTIIGFLIIAALVLLSVVSFMMR